MLAVDTDGREFYLQVSVNHIPAKRDMIPLCPLGKASPEWLLGSVKGKTCSFVRAQAFTKIC